MLSEQAEPSPFRFAEIAGDAGIDFVHFSGTTAEKYFPTANGSVMGLRMTQNSDRSHQYCEHPSPTPGPVRRSESTLRGSRRSGVGHAGDRSTRPDACSSWRAMAARGAAR